MNRSFLCTNYIVLQSQRSFREQEGNLSLFCLVEPYYHRQTEMANSDTSVCLLLQDGGGHIDISHLCVERLFVVLRNALLSDFVTSWLLRL